MQCNCDIRKIKYKILLEELFCIFERRIVGACSQLDNTYMCAAKHVWLGYPRRLEEKSNRDAGGSSGEGERRKLRQSASFLRLRYATTARFLCVFQSNKINRMSLLNPRPSFLLSNAISAVYIDSQESVFKLMII